MKKHFGKLMAALVLSSIALSTAACAGNDDNGGNGNTQPTKENTLTVQNARLCINLAADGNSNADVDLYSSADVKDLVRISDSDGKTVAIDEVSVVSKTGDCFAVNGNTLTAQKEGQGKLNLRVTGGGKTYDAECEVTVGDAYDKTIGCEDLYYSGNSGCTYEEYAGEIGGRSGVYEYRTGDPKFVGVWDMHLDAKTATFGSLSAMYKAGYRYITYDIYQPKSPNEAKWHYQLYTGMGNYSGWYDENLPSYVDYITFIDKNEQNESAITGKLMYDRWVTCAIDLEFMYYGGGDLNFFVCGNAENQPMYIDNFRYWYTGEFMDKLPDERKTPVKTEIPLCKEKNVDPSKYFVAPTGSKSSIEAEEYEGKNAYKLHFECDLAEGETAGSKWAQRAFSTRLCETASRFDYRYLDFQMYIPKENNDLFLCYFWFNGIDQAWCATDKTSAKVKSACITITDESGNELNKLESGKWLNVRIDLWHFGKKESTNFTFGTQENNVTYYVSDMHFSVWRNPETEYIEGDNRDDIGSDKFNSGGF